MTLVLWKESISKFIHRNINKRKNNSNEKDDSNKSPRKNSVKIVIDEPTQEAILDFDKYSVVFSNIIINSPPIFSIGIFGDWGTGKTTLMQMTRNELDIHPEILTIWFDAWKYERDEYLALVPLLKLIETEIKNSKHENKWQILKEGVKKTIIALIESTRFNGGLGKYGSVEITFGSFIKSLRAGGSVEVDG